MLSTWARQMKILYGAIFWVFLASLLVLFAIPFFKTTPTCFDGIQNQGETAPDKGGPCKALDERLLSPVSVKYTRIFPVKDDKYAIVAYLDNPNKEAGIKKFEYRFDIYTEDGILVHQKEGDTFILPEAVNPIVESSIFIPKYKPVYVVFNYKPPVWERMDNPTKQIEVELQSISSLDKKPKIEASVKNLSVNEIRDIHFIAIVFDKKGNAIAVNKSFIKRLKGGEEKDIVFVWPNPFLEEVGKVEIHTLVEPEI